MVKEIFKITSTGFGLNKFLHILLPESNENVVPLRDSAYTSNDPHTSKVVDGPLPKTSWESKLQAVWILSTLDQFALIDFKFIFLKLTRISNRKSFF